MCTSNKDVVLRLIQQTKALDLSHITLSPHYIGNDQPLPVPLDCVPHELGQLRRLRFLNLGFNDLVQLPTEIWGLRKLEYLGLHGNLLKRIPAEIIELRALMTLDLRHNNLDYLPIELGWLPRLQSLLVVKGNPLRNIPPAVVRGGDDEVLRWLKWRATHSTRT